MPSFADSISPAEAWDLVHFIQSLSPDYPKNATGGARSQIKNQKGPTATQDNDRKDGSAGANSAE
jgi:hypothetical protein